MTNKEKIMAKSKDTQPEITKVMPFLKNVGDKNKVWNNGKTTRSLVLIRGQGQYQERQGMEVP